MLILVQKCNVSLHCYSHTALGMILSEPNDAKCLIQISPTAFTADYESTTLSFSCALHEKTDTHTIFTTQITPSADATSAAERGV